jgi:vitamin B12 transporter
MSSIIQAARRRRTCLLVSSFLVPIVSLGISAANAQQSASPDLLPAIEVNPPPEQKRSRPQPPLDRASVSRRAVQAPTQQAPAQAQPSGPATQAPTLVVSPTATVTPIDQVASSVTVITAKDIERDQRRTVPDALATVPGLNVVQSGGPGGLTSVFMRGTNANHTKVLIDGIDASDPSNPARVFDLGQLLTADIQQIEVLRGPQSGLYGADAIGGVISIITKKGEGPPRATGMIEGGSFGTFNQTAALSGAQDRINYAFNVAHFRSTDTPVTPLELLPPGQKAIGNNYDNMTYSTKLGADVSENLTLNGVARYTDATLRFTTDSGFPSFPNAAQSTQIVHQFLTRGEAVWSVLDGRIKNYFGVNYTNQWNSNISPGDAAPTINTGDRIKYDWHSVAQLAPFHKVIIGAEQETETLKTATLSAQNVNRAGYVELQSQFADRLFLVENLRQDDNDRFGTHPTFRLAPAVIVPITETKFKGSYGSGFKAPTLTQLFVSFPQFFFFANPNLKPEESTGYDAGFEQPLFNDRVRFGSTYFHNDITNLIAPNVSFTTNINIGRATTEGTENFVAATITDRIRVRADYTFARTVDATTGLELLRRPKDKWSANVIWNPIDPLTISATVLHTGSFVDGNRDFSIPRLLAPAYTIVNVAADYVITDQVKVFGRVDNLFNVHYQNPTGFLQPSLGVFAGVRVASYGVK